MSIDRFMETIIHFASTGPYSRELLKAREDYFEQLRVVSEEQDKYTERLRSFLDWYLFDRPLSKEGIPPVDMFYDKFNRTFNKEDEVIYDGLRNTFISLFIVKKSDDEGVWVKDLITKRKYFVEDEVPKGFFKDEIFQVRLIPFKGGFQFGDSFTFHPLAANKIILKRVKKLDRKSAEMVRAFLDDLVACRLNAEKYRHIDAVRFYSEEV